MKELTFSCAHQPAPFRIGSNQALPFVDNTLYWHIVNVTEDIKLFEQVMLFKDVFDHYNFQLWPLRLKSTEDYDKAYFRIAFVPHDQKVRDRNGKTLFKCPFNFNLKQNSGTLAVCYYRTNGPWDGWVFVNEQWFWDIVDSDGKYDLKKVLIHELGHGVGLDHTTAKGDIMEPVYDSRNEWTEDSRRGLNVLYESIRYETYLLTPEAEIFYENEAIDDSEKKRRARGGIFTKRDLI